MENFPPKCRNFHFLHQGKVAIITGSGQGLGKAFANQLLMRGAKVFFNFHVFLSVCILHSFLAVLHSIFWYIKVVFQVMLKVWGLIVRSVYLMSKLKLDWKPWQSLKILMAVKMFISSGNFYWLMFFTVQIISLKNKLSSLEATLVRKIWPHDRPTDGGEV